MERLKTFRTIEVEYGIMLIKKDKECVDMIRQNPGVESALDRLSGIVVDGHLNSCILTLDRGENQGERKREDLLSRTTGI